MTDVAKTDAPLFVPVVLTHTECVLLVEAARAVILSAPSNDLGGASAPHPATIALASAMTKVAEAADAKREEADRAR
jgi:hypothetical protein